MEDYGIHGEVNKRKMNIARSFIGDDVENLQKSFNDFLQKGKAAQEGEQREWNGKKYKKAGGKWLPVTQDRQSGKKDASTNNTSTQPSSSSVDNHEIAQMTHMKNIMDENPEKAYEIFQALSPEAQQKVPQDVVNKLVENSHSEKQGTADAVFDQQSSEVVEKEVNEMVPSLEELKSVLSKLEKKVDRLSGGVSSSAANSRKLKEVAVQLGKLQQQIKTLNIKKAHNVLGIK